MIYGDESQNKEWLDIVFDGIKYNDKKENEQINISASMISNEPLQIYLRNKFGIQDKKDFSQMTLGSIVHKGLETIFKDKEYYVTEYPIEYIDHNGIKLSATIDLLHTKDGEKYIADYKTGKSFTVNKKLIPNIKKFKKNDLENNDIWNESYFAQLNFARYLLWKDSGKDKYRDMRIIFINKEGGARAGKDDIPDLYFLQVPVLPMLWIDNKVKQISDEILEYFKNDKVPPECSDLWFRNSGGVTIPTKCEMYCSYKDVCPAYKQRMINETNAIAYGNKKGNVW